jgi:(3R)-3-hydroxyacyl-CoA dehydrogenase / 3a,7a,12a-trihydroxy-5b-cholest-24-enoyl-CoA hydratase / enoyl-CoA hydratase 2
MSSAPPNGERLVRPYPERRVTVDGEQVREFAVATGDDPARYAGSTRTPPLFVAALMADAIRAIVEDRDLVGDGGRVLHAEQEVLFRRPLRVGEVMTVKSCVTAVGSFAFGRGVTAVTQLVDGSHRTAARLKGTFVAPGGGGTGGQARTLTRPEPRAPRGEVRMRVTHSTPADYARASGDTNPLHVDGLAARDAGFPDVIVHGLCTMAMGAVAAMETLAAGDPDFLRYMHVRFSRPVLPDSTLVFRLYETPAPRTFVLRAVVDERPVLKHAWLTVR